LDVTGGKLAIDTDEVLYRVLCLPDDACDLDDDADMASRVRLFIKDCSAKQSTDQLPRVLMDPVDRWLDDLMNVNITNGMRRRLRTPTSDSAVIQLSGLDVFNATSFMPPLIDWQMEAVDLNAALSAAIKEMGNQLLLLRPAVFKNPFDIARTGGEVKKLHLQHNDDQRRKVSSPQTATEDFWQPQNPWSAAQRDANPHAKPGHAARVAHISPRSVRNSPHESERSVVAVAEADVRAASDKVFASVQKRVVIATRELIAEKLRRMLPPQWLHPCVAISGFVFKMCELEPQRRLRKEFLQSDVRLLLYAIYTR
jgi:hypothetical protein